MKSFQCFAVLTILALLSSSCTASSTSNISQSPNTSLNSTATSRAVANGMITSAPSIGKNNSNETILPAPSPEFTDSITPDSVRFSEDNLLQYFQFGMSYNDVEKRINDLKMCITQDSSDSSNDDKPGWWGISTYNVDFCFDSKNKLYLVGVRDCLHTSNWETAKGLQIGDSLEKLQLLYGKEDEFDEIHNEYIYYKKGFMFSVSMNSGVVDGWSFFINILNNPTKQSMMTGQAEGDSIVFNEDTFMKIFPFGMGHKDVEKKLNDLGVRITGMLFEDANDNDYWIIDTDHVSFCIDYYTDRLDFIDVKGWNTAKGLKEGDSIKRLHQLYGKESEKDDNTYIYKKRGYKFRVDFTVDNSQEAETVSEWYVYNN